MTDSTYGRDRPPAGADQDIFALAVSEAEDFGFEKVGRTDDWDGLPGGTAYRRESGYFIASRNKFGSPRIAHVAYIDDETLETADLADDDPWIPSDEYLFYTLVEDPDDVESRVEEAYRKDRAIAMQDIS